MDVAYPFSFLGSIFHTCYSSSLLWIVGNQPPVWCVWIPATFPFPLLVLGNVIPGATGPMSTKKHMFPWIVGKMGNEAKSLPLPSHGTQYFLLAISGIIILCLLRDGFFHISHSVEICLLCCLIWTSFWNIWKYSGNTSDQLAFQSEMILRI